MSPRAAWRLEAAGFGPVYDYVAGKSDWLPAGLPFEGSGQLAGCGQPPQGGHRQRSTTAQEALRRLHAPGFGPVVVLNQAGVVMGTVRRDQLESAAEGTEAGALLRFGVSAVRPSEQAADLAHRMGHAQVTRVVVTAPTAHWSGCSCCVPDCEFASHS